MKRVNTLVFLKTARSAPSFPFLSATLTSAALCALKPFQQEFRREAVRVQPGISGEKDPYNSAPVLEEQRHAVTYVGSSISFVLL